MVFIQILTLEMQIKPKPPDAKYTAEYGWYFKSQEMIPELYHKILLSPRIVLYLNRTFFFWLVRWFEIFFNSAHFLFKFLIFPIGRIFFELEQKWK